MRPFFFAGGWKSGKWSECRRKCPKTFVKARAAYINATHDYLVIRSHRVRSVYCAPDHEGSGCSIGARPSSQRPCKVLCRKGCVETPWSPWTSCASSDRPEQPQHCPTSSATLLGLQSRRRRLHSCLTETEQRVCFYQSCGSTWARPSSTSSLPVALPLASDDLPVPEPLSSTYKPFLFVGPWSDCRKQDKGANNEVTKARTKRSSSQKPSIAELFSQSSKNGWAPQLPPSELEISFVASSLQPPPSGIQRRDVICRGEDGEELPFR